MTYCYNYSGNRQVYAGENTGTKTGGGQPRNGPWRFPVWDDDAGYDTSDPKHPDWADRVADLFDGADDARKRPRPIEEASQQHERGGADHTSERPQADERPPEGPPAVPIGGTPQL